MKLMIASDIHGSAYYCQKMLEKFKDEKAGKLVLLGDILYHGPRNDLPRDYAPKKVAAMLNDIKEKIFCVRGNCEAEVDQMMLEFPVMADYGVIFFEASPKSIGTLEENQHTIYLTHGHVYNEENLPPLASGDVLLNGHTHVPALRVHPGKAGKPEEGRDKGTKPQYVYMNPGSVSIPKGDSVPSYMTVEGLTSSDKTLFCWKSLEDGEEFERYEI